MPIQQLDPRHDAAKDEMRFAYLFAGQAVAEVCVPRAAMVHGESYVKARITGYFKYHDGPQPRTSIRIPDYQFDPIRRQPEG